jgi:NADH-quinone oxidoreductase subunit J
MMLDINVAPLREGFVRYLPVAAFVGALILVEMILVLGAWPDVATTAPVGSNTKVLGFALYTDYVYPFEIAAVILLVAMVAAIALTMRPHTRAKYQKPDQQVRVRREDCVRLVKNMSAETKD